MFVLAIFFRAAGEFDDLFKFIIRWYKKASSTKREALNRFCKDVAYKKFMVHSVDGKPKASFKDQHRYCVYYMRFVLETIESSTENDAKTKYAHYSTCATYRFITWFLERYAEKDAASAANYSDENPKGAKSACLKSAHSYVSTVLGDLSKILHGEWYGKAKDGDRVGCLPPKVTCTDHASIISGEKTESKARQRESTTDRNDNIEFHIERLVKHHTRLAQLCFPLSRPRSTGHRGVRDVCMLCLNRDTLGRSKELRGTEYLDLLWRRLNLAEEGMEGYAVEEFDDVALMLLDDTKIEHLLTELGINGCRYIIIGRHWHPLMCFKFTLGLMEFEDQHVFGLNDKPRLMLEGYKAMERLKVFHADKKINKAMSLSTHSRAVTGMLTATGTKIDGKSTHQERKLGTYLMDMSGLPEDRKKSVGWMTGEGTKDSFSRSYFKNFCREVVICFKGCPQKGWWSNMDHPPTDSIYGVARNVPVPPSLLTDLFPIWWTLEDNVGDPDHPIHFGCPEREIDDDDDEEDEEDEEGSSGAEGGDELDKEDVATFADEGANVTGHRKYGRVSLRELVKFLGQVRIEFVQGIASFLWFCEQDTAEGRMVKMAFKTLWADMEKHLTFLKHPDWEPFKLKVWANEELFKEYKASAQRRVPVRGPVVGSSAGSAPTADSQQLQAALDQIHAGSKQLPGDLKEVFNLAVGPLCDLVRDGFARVEPTMEEIKELLEQCLVRDAPEEEEEATGSSSSSTPGPNRAARPSAPQPASHEPAPMPARPLTDTEILIPVPTPAVGPEVFANLPEGFTVTYEARFSPENSETNIPVVKLPGLSGGMTLERVFEICYSPSMSVTVLNLRHRSKWSPRGSPIQGMAKKYGKVATFILSQVQQAHPHHTGPTLAALPPAELAAILQVACDTLRGDTRFLNKSGDFSFTVMSQLPLASKNALAVLDTVGKKNKRKK
ncbi:hypothetical protein HDU98_000722 [Podochytrium sp. JEL0797]|nr:hypothetical protein HDU98_000722 [Podochytrium sp. JEL0797]